MLKFFHETMENCAGIIEEHMPYDRPDSYVEDILDKTYENADSEDYQYDKKLPNAIYMARYGYAYAYEYSVIYQILLGDYADDTFSVTSIGCGSCMDAWSLAYENSRLSQKKKIMYAGVDLNVWDIQFTPEHGNAMEKAYTNGTQVEMQYPMPGNDMNADILKFFEEKTYPYEYNVLFFPKILNELSEDVMRGLLERIGKNADKFKADRTYYFCISHSRDKYSNLPIMKEIAQRICETINYDNRFEIDDSLPGRWTGLGQEKMLQVVSPPNEYACYEFPKDQRGLYEQIQSLNPDFTPEGKMKDERILLNAYLSNHQMHQFVSRTSTSIFQIIKLEPKRSNP